MLSENILSAFIFVEKISQKYNHRLHKARAGTIVKARDNLLNDSENIIIIPFDLNNRFYNLKVLSKNLRIFFDFLAIVDAAWSCMLEAAIRSIVFIENEIDDFFYIKDVQTVLDLLEIKSFCQVEIVFKLG